jgi:subtilisin family serine protease
MAQISGSETIPSRKVEVANERPMSRSTHYLLTEEEADRISQDSRVLAVQKTIKDLNVRIKPAVIFNKGNDYVPGEVNWGLYRCFNSESSPNWGTDGEAAINAPDDFLKLFPEGENVDVVISDGFIDPNHPEMKINPDGTGPSRVIRYNWYQHNMEVAGTPPSEYLYTRLDDPEELPNSDHGMHVAGIACGNTFGWARKANIYNISPYVDDIYLHIDYIRAFHRNKPINPKTGRRNPTIVNCSWGFFGYHFGSMASVRYRNQTFTNVNDFTVEYLQNNFNISCVKPALVLAFVNNEPVLRDPLPEEMLVEYGYVEYSVEIDILDAISEGIIFVGASGNSSIYSAQLGDIDWSNRICFTSPNNSPIPNCYFTSVGGTPASAFNWLKNGEPTTISVGAAANQVVEKKSNYSTFGPRVDIFAPGNAIMSSVAQVPEPEGDPSRYSDPRDPTHYIKKQSGTSMASPQVCGVLACMLEKYPNMNQDDARNFLFSRMTKDGQLNSDESFFTRLTNTKNKYLYFPLERAEDNGTKYPDNSYYIRNNFGQLYPRIKNKFFK